MAQPGVLHLSQLNLITFMSERAALESPGETGSAIWFDYLVGQLAPSVALAALRQGGVIVSRTELLGKVREGGIARHDGKATQLVAKYDGARKKGAARIKLAIVNGGKRHPMAVSTIKDAWKIIGDKLLKGVDMDCIFAAEDELHTLATRVAKAVQLLEESGPARKKQKV